MVINSKLVLLKLERNSKVFEDVCSKELNFLSFLFYKDVKPKGIIFIVKNEEKYFNESVSKQ